MQLILIAIILVVGVLVGVFMPDELRDKIRRETCDNLQKRVGEYCQPPVAPSPPATPDKPQQ